MSALLSLTRYIFSVLTLRQRISISGSMSGPSEQALNVRLLDLLLVVLVIVSATAVLYFAKACSHTGDDSQPYRAPMLKVDLPTARRRSHSLRTCPANI